ncbi:MAG: serine/threonine-protein kinase, partial [Myxococcota bacterium]
MGSVYKARDIERGNPVAVKVLLRGSLELEERFTREAQLLMALDHPAIVACLDAGVTVDGRRFMVMEWLDGIDLGAFVRNRRLSVSDALILTARLAEALGAVHERRVVHRDVKPSNIFLPDRDINRAKLLDFGVAHWSSAATLTALGAQIGTPSYMAPEQIRGDDVDARADVFALGCVLYSCLGGKPAYSGHHLQDVFRKILMEQAPRISRVVRGVPPSVSALLDAMMARDRDMRPADGVRVVQRIAWIRANVPLSDEPPQLVQNAAGSGAVTEKEQRLVSVVAVAPEAAGDSRGDGPAVAADERTLAMHLTPGGTLQRHESLGARFERLTDGVLVGIFDTRTAATDQADNAARCALDLHAMHPDADIAVATGRAHVKRKRTVGQVMGRVEELFEVTGRGQVRVCEVTARLIEKRFEVARDAHGFTLVRERQLLGQARVLGNHIPFVGRARELASLQVTLSECVEEPRAQAVLITGAVGIGKSRLTRHFETSVADRVEI